MVIKMKILVCASEYYPKGSGIANVAYNVVKKLEKKGIKCEICSPTGPDIKIGNIGEYGRLSLLYFWYKVNKFYKTHNHEYDLVWLHNPLFINKNPFKKCLVTIHTTPSGQTINRIYPWHLHIYKLIISKVDNYCINKLDKKTRFTVVDPTVFNELVKIGINQKNINYIPNGVDIDLFKPSKNKNILKKGLQLPESDEIILSLGRIDDQKKPLELIRIFSKLSSKIKNISLVVAGNGELLENAEELVKKRNLKNVKFLGYVDHKNKAPKLYSSANYYIMTSIYEGQPLTLLEAMASGLKCIVSDIPNLKMIVEEANCGITIDIYNEDKTAQDIIEYINSNNSNHSINSRDYAVQNFDWEIIAEKYLEKIIEIIK